MQAASMQCPEKLRGTELGHCATRRYQGHGMILEAARNASKAGSKLNFVGPSLMGSHGGVHHGGHSCDAGFAALWDSFCSIPPRFCASLLDVALLSGLYILCRDAVGQHMDGSQQTATGKGEQHTADHGFNYKNCRPSGPVFLLGA